MLGNLVYVLILFFIIIIIVIIIIIITIVHRCGAGGNMRACHAADPGSIPGWDEFPGWGFFGVFPHL